MFKALSHCAKKFRRNRSRLTAAAARGLFPVKSVAFEPLEDRRLFNSVTLTNGVLNITGSTTVGSHLTAYLVDSGKEIDASGDNYSAIVVALSSVKQISITGGSGADYIFVDSGITLPVIINGGDGNDTVRGGGGSNTITEGNGSDYITIEGTGGKVTAGNGNDIILGSPGNDTITAGSGNDSLDGADGNDSITCGNGNDTVTGDSGNDTIVAGNGIDSINGGLGDDYMTVGTGKSTVIPGSGTNHITIGNTADTIVPSAGINTVVTTSGQTVSNSSSGSTGSGSTGSGTTTSNTSTGTTTTTASTSWTTISATKPSSSTAPQAVMQLLNPTSMVGTAIDVRAITSVMGTGLPIDANYSWNFGDPNGEYNVLPGFNATHVYLTAGTYTITLTLTNSAHAVSTVSTKVVITADTRKQIYVNGVSGSDNNNGSTPALAVKTAAKADALMTNNSEVFFDRGQTFNISTPFLVHYANVLVGAYGSGNQPILNYTAPAVGSDIVSTNSNLSIGDTIQDLAFTTLNGTEPTLDDEPMAVMAGGTDTAVLRCTFDYVEYGVNASGAPNGLTIEDSTSPLANGVQGYFLWDQGNDTSVIGNYSDGSVEEHVMRTSSANDILAYKNNFSNSDGKGCIEIHWGQYAWVDSNTVTGGDIRVGPLGLWGEPVTSATNDCVIQNNTVNNTFIASDPGSHDISIHNNIIKTNTGMMMNISGTDSDGRVSSDLQIFNNTGISTGTTGIFLQLESYVNGISLENNLFVEPNLIVGANNAAPVYVVPNSLSSFTYINGNVWQEPKTFLATAKGGINLVGGETGSIGSLTPAAWNAESMVGTDYFAATTLSSTYAPATGSVAATADAAVAGVFTDFNGKARPLTGSWTAGAIQL